MPGICPRCEKTVYFNEEMIAMGKSYHKSCFLCANKSCNRKLDSNNLTTHDNELYCKICYGRLFGPKGYGYGVGAGVLSTDTGVNGHEPSGDNVSHLARAFVAPIVDGKPPKGQADSESKVGSPVRTNFSFGNGSGYRKEISPTTSTVKKTTMTFDNFGNRIDMCPRCNKQVYLAEKMMGAGKAWHKMTCFNCAECHKRLESTTQCEKEGEIYCKTCYAKKWGPSGYGHGIDPGVRKID